MVYLNICVFFWICLEFYVICMFGVPNKCVSFYVTHRCCCPRCTTPLQRVAGKSMGWGVLIVSKIMYVGLIGCIGV